MRQSVFCTIGGSSGNNWRRTNAIDEWENGKNWRETVGGWNRNVYTSPYAMDKCTRECRVCVYIRVCASVWRACTLQMFIFIFGMFKLFIVYAPPHHRTCRPTHYTLCLCYIFIEVILAANANSLHHLTLSFRPLASTAPACALLRNKIEMTKCMAQKPHACQTNAYDAMQLCQQGIHTVSDTQDTPKHFILLKCSGSGIDVRR